MDITETARRAPEPDAFDRRADELIAQMTVEEKIFQMMHIAAGIPRLGIRPYIWWNEALHGVARAGVATVFPQAIGMAASFDAPLLRRVADVISTEGRAKYHEFQRRQDYGMYKGLTFWSPNVNIFRDPRWGRGHETYGEDPYLTSILGGEFVRGIQGNDPDHLKAVACAKHFAVHSGPEGERHHFDAVVSKKDLFETYLPAFEYCVREAGVESVMGAYNRLNGDPCCGNGWLLQELLRDTWGFRGHVVSDCEALCDFHEHHKVTSNAVETAAKALANGCDIECGNFYAHLLQALEQGLVTEDQIDTAVHRLLRARLKLGILDDEGVTKADEEHPYASIPYEVVACEEHRALSLEMAKASVTLLKNDGLLPLSREHVRSVAVIGPNADSVRALLGNYNGTPTEAFTVLRGIRDVGGPALAVTYAEGSHLYRDFVEDWNNVDDRISEAVSAAERADVAVVAVGLDATLEGEQGDANNFDASGDKQTLDLPACQERLLKAVCETGTPTVVVLLAGSAIALNYAQEHANAVVCGWYPGEQGGRAIAQVLFGDHNPSGRLPVTFYRSNDDLPPFEDYAMAGRTYRYLQKEPLYPFGYGLSYTSFAYSGLSLSAGTVSAGDPLTVRVTVRNAGERDGHEVVQLYLKNHTSAVPMPHWSLAGFQRVFLRAGEETEVSFTLCPEQMAYVDEEGRRVLAPGRFTVYVGGSQPDSRSGALTGTRPLSAEFTVQ